MAMGEWIERSKWGRRLATTPTSVQARDEGSKHQAAAAARSSEEVVGGVEVVVWEGKETRG